MIGVTVMPVFPELPVKLQETGFLEETRFLAPA
jgi:hypothetical protein